MPKQKLLTQHIQTDSRYSISLRKLFFTVPELFTTFTNYLH